MPLHLTMNEVVESAHSTTVEEKEKQLLSAYPIAVAWNPSFHLQ